METPTIKETLQALTASLQLFEAQMLLAHILQKNKAWVIAHSDEKLNPEQEHLLNRAMQFLANDMPLPYVVGSWEFYNLKFEITPDVLIPRPETELIVETALAWTQAQPKPALRLIDVGTGSGILAITLAKHLINATVHATDISAAAIKVAQLNAQIHKVNKRITFFETDLFPENSEIETYDLIVSNPPYIPTETLHSLEVYGKEPTLALDGGPSGLEIIARLLKLSKQKAAGGSLILIEFDSTLGKEIYQLAKSIFNEKTSIEILKDLSGRDRVLKIET